MSWKISILTLLILGILGYGSIKIGEYRFESMVSNEIDDLLLQSKSTPSRIISETDLNGLPEPVQRYLRYAQVVGKKPINTVRLKQTGTIRMDPNKGKMNFEATQFYCTDPGSFVWNARVQMFPGIWITGRDKYLGGSGNMLIKLLALVPLVDAKGFELDQGTILRFINEHFWFPTAYLNDYFTWIPIDEQTVEAVVDYGGIRSRIIYYFNQSGQMINFETERYRSLSDGRSELTRWSTPIRNYREMNGFFVPTEGEAVWHMQTQNFNYINLRITDLQYDYGWNQTE